MCELHPSKKNPNIFNEHIKSKREREWFFFFENIFSFLNKKRKRLISVCVYYYGSIYGNFQCQNEKKKLTNDYCPYHARVFKSVCGTIIINKYLVCIYIEIWSFFFFVFWIFGRHRIIAQFMNETQVVEIHLLMPQTACVCVCANPKNKKKQENPMNECTK